MWSKDTEYVGTIHIYEKIINQPPKFFPALEPAIFELTEEEDQTFEIKLPPIIDPE